MRWRSAASLAALLVCVSGKGCVAQSEVSQGADGTLRPAATSTATTSTLLTESSTSAARTTADTSTSSSDLDETLLSPALSEPTADLAPAPTQAAPWRARLVFTGDVLSHGAVSRQALANGSDDLAYDYQPMFDQVRTSLQDADLAICHLESPLSPDNRDLSGYPLFNVPGDLAASLAGVGYDGCSTASNHSLDRGVDGIKATLGLLEGAGLGHAGMARTAAEAETPTLYEIRGITIGHLSYTYGLNGLALPPDQLWAVHVIDADAIEAEAAAAVAAGADFVVVSMQWGVEYVSRPIAPQRRLAERLLSSDDIDLIVGSHAHVVQPIGHVGNKFVIYGLGNFLTNQSPLSCASCPAATADGVIVGVDLAHNADGQIEVSGLGAVPTWVDRRTFTIVDVADRLADDIGPNTRAHFQRSWNRTVRVLRALDVDIVVKGDPVATDSGTDE